MRLQTKNLPTLTSCSLTRSAHYTITYIVFVMFAMCVSVFHGHTAYAQSVGDIEISEIMYDPREGSEWIEIVNLSDSGIDITDLEVRVGTTDSAIVAAEGTDDTLATGATAIIAVSAEDFDGTTPYTGYDTTGSLYTSSFSLPETDGTVVALVTTSNTVLHAITYNSDIRSEGTGISLHLGLGDTLVPAPATPGEIANNPIVDTYAPQVADAVVTTSAEGGTESNNIIFLNDNDKVHLDIIALSPPEALQVQIAFSDGNYLTLTGVGDEGSVTRRFTYTITSTSQSGEITYRIRKDGTTITSGVITHSGKRVAIDRDTPSASFVITPTTNASRKRVVATITDTHLPEEAHYKIHTERCTTSTIYDEASDEDVVIVDSSGIATVVVWDVADNGKYVCLKATDLAGKTIYTASPAISGVIDTLQITEIYYKPTTGSQGEWVEIQNNSAQTIVPTDFELMDENTPRPITNYSGSVYSPSASLSPREIGIIAKNPDQFLTDFPTYRGPLFKSTATLNDNGNTLGLRLESTGNILDTITYTRDDGAYGDGDSLHVRRSGLITADTPSPGDGIEQQPESPRPSGGGTQQPTQTTDTSIPSFYLLSVDDRNVQEGQNLFFTNASSTTVKLRITDDITEYTSTNIDRYLTINLTDIHESGSEKSRIEKIRSVNSYGGEVTLTYTIYFAGGLGSAATDNRVKIYLDITDGDGNHNNKKNILTFVRNTTKPTLTNASTASILGFAAADADTVIVPINITNITFGDWVRFTYEGTCGEALTRFAVRNGSHGILYELEPNERHNDCKIIATDSAGNKGSVVLPIVLVGQ